MAEEKPAKTINFRIFSAAVPAKDGEAEPRCIVVPPSYGSQEYWEERYSRETAESEEDPSPFHSWYFSYEEMRPLLLPLILGTEEADALLESFDRAKSGNTPTTQKQDAKSSTLSNEEGENEANPQTEVNDEKEGKAENIKSNVNEDDEDGDDEDEEAQSGDEGGQQDDDGESENYSEEAEFEEASSEEEDGTDDEVAVTRASLSSAPISILEVGCGDVPLGTGLVKDLPSEHLARVVCIDYSASVIQKMEEKYAHDSEPDPKKMKTTNNQQEPPKKETIPLEFQKVDARNMPYSDEIFHMVLEKGTLDAMLSDRKSGSVNCQQIIRESARVLKTGGIMVLVSHLNAFDTSGMDWMEDVVFGGLRSLETSSWAIEVHGNDGGDEQPGPAVYVIHKKPKDDKSSKIPVQFFSY
jgi:ubiquinone/menaquinone biosynthesis C-methylase UbiE